MKRGVLERGGLKEVDALLRGVLARLRRAANAAG